MEKKNRTIKYKKPIALLIIGIVVMVASIGSYGFGLLVDKEGNSIIECLNVNLVRLILLLLALLGIFLAFVGGVSIIDTFRVNKWLRNLPYAFDYEKELIRWKKTGTNKNIKRKREKYNLDKWPQNYIEWKDQILTDCEENQLKEKNNENFRHYLIRKLRNRENEVKASEYLIIPFGLLLPNCIFQMLEGVKDYPEIKVASVMLTYVVMIIALAFSYFKKRDEISFLSDYIDARFDNVEQKSDSNRNQ